MPVMRFGWCRNGARAGARSGFRRGGFRREKRASSGARLRSAGRHDVGGRQAPCSRAPPGSRRQRIYVGHFADDVLSVSAFPDACMPSMVSMASRDTVAHRGLKFTPGTKGPGNRRPPRLLRARFLRRTRARGGHGKRHAPFRARLELDFHDFGNHVARPAHPDGVARARPFAVSRPRCGALRGLRPPPMLTGLRRATGVSARCGRPERLCVRAWSWPEAREFARYRPARLLVRPLWPLAPMALVLNTTPSISKSMVPRICSASSEKARRALRSRGRRGRAPRPAPRPIRAVP